MRRALFLVMLGLMFASQGAWAQLSHVSINQRLSGLGQSPSLRVNIVAQSVNLDKVQFIVEQKSGRERLMVKPMNTYMLLLSGVEDVEDRDAQLVIQEYQINRWQEIKRIPLFEGGARVAAKAEVKPQIPAQQPAHSQVSTASGQTKVPVGSALVTNDALVTSNCQLDYQPPQTLWRLGSAYAASWELSTYGAMLAIFDANPKAFNGGKINGLRADVKLNCPSESLKQSYRDAKRARETFESLQAE